MFKAWVSLLDAGIQNMQSEIKLETYICTKSFLLVQHHQYYQLAVGLWGSAINTLKLIVRVLYGLQWKFT